MDAEVRLPKAGEFCANAVIPTLDLPFGTMKTDDSAAHAYRRRNRTYCSRRNEGWLFIFLGAASIVAQATRPAV